MLAAEPLGDRPAGHSVCVALARAAAVWRRRYAPRSAPRSCSSCTSIARFRTRIATCYPYHQVEAPQFVPVVPQGYYHWRRYARVSERGVTTKCGAEVYRLLDMLAELSSCEYSSSASSKMTAHTSANVSVRSRRLDALAGLVSRMEASLGMGAPSSLLSACAGGTGSGGRHRWRALESRSERRRHAGTAADSMAEQKHWSRRGSGSPRTVR